MCLFAAAVLVTGPATGRVRAEPWDVSGNTSPTVPAPIGSFQHDGSGFYSGIEFLFMHQNRALGKQVLAFRGLVDSAGFLSGTPGTFIGSRETALEADALGRTSWQPGSRLTLGYRLENGWNFSLSWLHLASAKYSGGASTQGPDFSNPGQNLENTFLFAPVFNFSPLFTGPVARIFTGGDISTNGFVIFGALNGIWNGASDMTILYSQRYDNYDLTGRFPIYETENARSYAMAGVRFSWIWERFQWRTEALGIDTQNQPLGAPPQQTTQPDWAARYVNTLSQRMYGPFIGTGHEVYLGAGFGFGCEVTVAALLDLAKERAKYIREDEKTQAKRSWSKFQLVPNVNTSFNLSWQPVDGLTFKAGWNAFNYFNTLYMKSPVGFNVGAIDPAYETKVYRLIQGFNVGVGYTW